MGVCEGLGSPLPLVFFYLPSCSFCLFLLSLSRSLSLFLSFSIVRRLSFSLILAHFLIFSPSFYLVISLSLSLLFLI